MKRIVPFFTLALLVLAFSCKKKEEEVDPYAFLKGTWQYANGAECVFDASTKTAKGTKVPTNNTIHKFVVGEEYWRNVTSTGADAWSYEQIVRFPDGKTVEYRKSTMTRKDVKVQALAREMARQMMAEDSVRRARLAAVEAAKTAAEQPIAKKPTQPETPRQTIAQTEPVRTQSVLTAPKGVISIGPSAQFNSELETTLIGGSVGLGYAVGRKVGVLVAADYHTGNHSAVFSTIGTTLAESYTTSSITLRPEFRFYPKRSFEGFFIGLNGTLMSYRAGGFKSSKLIVNSETAGGGGLVMGVNIATSSRLNFEFGIAGAIITGANDEVIVGSGALRIGYAF